MTPNMSVEIIEAIHQMYEDHPDVEADCYLALIHPTETMLTGLSNRAQDGLDNMRRCRVCGTPLDFHTVRVYHDELENKPIEYLTLPYCPVCDVEGYDD